MKAKGLLLQGDHKNIVDNIMIRIFIGIEVGITQKKKEMKLITKIKTNYIVKNIIKTIMNRESTHVIIKNSTKIITLKLTIKKKGTEVEIEKDKIMGIINKQMIIIIKIDIMITKYYI